MTEPPFAHKDVFISRRARMRAGALLSGATRRRFTTDVLASVIVQHAAVDSIAAIVTDTAHALRRRVAHYQNQIEQQESFLWAIDTGTAH
jgi:hypothetical protein